MSLDIIFVLVVLLLFFAAFLLLRTTLSMRQIKPVETLQAVEIDTSKAAAHLAAAIQIETISNDVETSPQITEKLRELRSLLRKNYPLVHTKLEREVVNEGSLLYLWKGSNPDLLPVLFTSHLDVVPADPDTLADWEHPPFSGAIDDEFIWGRGTLDIKSQVVAILEAAEILLKEGFQPERDIYLAFGHDEEIGGANGARKMVELLQGSDVHLAAVIDEGGVIIDGMIPGVDGPIAMVGTAEKGYLSLKLTAKGAEGHSSMPPKTTAIGALSRVLAKIEAYQQPARLKSIAEIYRSLGAAASFKYQLIFSNLWLFGGVARKTLSKSPQTNATIRTTTGLTMVKGGFKENVLPPTAEALVNFRLLPGDSIADACERVKKIIGDEPVTFEPVENAHWEATPVSPVDTQAFEILDTVIRQVFEGVVVAPYLVLGATDSRYYADISDGVYRFSPYLIEQQDMKRMHGLNERLALKSLDKMVVFFHQLMQSWGKEF